MEIESPSRPERRKKPLPLMPFPSTSSASTFFPFHHPAAKPKFDLPSVPHPSLLHFLVERIPDDSECCTTRRAVPGAIRERCSRSRALQRDRRVSPDRPCCPIAQRSSPRRF